MSTTTTTEHVLVVPTKLFHSIGHFQGFRSDYHPYIDQLLDPLHTSYRPRHEMETDPSFKQLIPYCIIRFQDSAGDVELFQYTRGKKQGEKRLHAKRSVGIGGHICTLDRGDACPYDVGMQRELDEEIAIGTSYQSSCVGLINDDQNDVGRVHLGVVHLIDVAEPVVKPREMEIEGAGFESIKDILFEIDQFETWSQICLKALFE